MRLKVRKEVGGRRVNRVKESLRGPHLAFIFQSSHLTEEVLLRSEETKDLIMLHGVSRPDSQEGGSKSVCVCVYQLVSAK